MKWLTCEFFPKCHFTVWPFSLERGRWRPSLCTTWPIYWCNYLVNDAIGTKSSTCAAMVWSTLASSVARLAISKITTWLCLRIANSTKSIQAAVACRSGMATTCWQQSLSWFVEMNVSAFVFVWLGLRAVEQIWRLGSGRKDRATERSISSLTNLQNFSYLASSSNCVIERSSAAIKIIWMRKTIAQTCIALEDILHPATITLFIEVVFRDMYVERTIESETAKLVEWVGHDWATYRRVSIIMNRNQN